MKLLKKVYGPLWLLLEILTLNLSVFYLGKLLNVYKKGEWYTKWYYWVLGFIFGIIPGLIMLFILNMIVTMRVCKKLDVKGSEIYLLPYPWIICLIIPFVGWSLFIVLYIYTHLWYIINLTKGAAEKYINVKK